MTLTDDLQQSARACEGAALALAHSLRPIATKPNNPNPAIVDTYREAEALSITCRAVMEEMAPILPLLVPEAKCIGKTPSILSTPGRVCNGFDSIAIILLSLFDTTNNAILDVAGNRSRSLVSSLQAPACFENMATHHGQLRALYGIIHLAAKIVHHTDVSDSLFVDVQGAGAHPELEPAKWRAAIKMDDFYGRCFGFHYSPEMRSVLRVVNIARGSVNKSHAEGDPSPQVIKNVAMLGWGWIYSNMVLMSNLGLTIDGVSQIGADNEHAMSVQALRKFMNLVEEPFVAGVTGLACADIALDYVFKIPMPGVVGGLEHPESAMHTATLRQALRSIEEPVSVRLMSHKHRPIYLPDGRGRSNKQRKASGPPTPMREQSRTEAVHTAIEKPSSPISKPGPAQIISRAEHQDLERSDAVKVSTGNVKRTNGGLETMTSAANTDFSPSPKGRGLAKSPGKRARASENSYLASTIKTELARLQTNVSNFLGLEEAKPAKGLIMHFHGGGFVSQSTASHQVYMKEWCADMSDCVLFSVDYKLSPEHKFPTALHECLYAYIWALQNALRIGTLAEKVVFAGDSAGGNLAVATALLVNDLGIRKPDGICVAYPALYVNVAWSPSRLLSFFDPMLPLSVLELCVKSYQPEGGDGRCNALLSPMMCSEVQMEALPPVTIICGSLDPLLDDAVSFAHKMKRAGRRGDIFNVIESMPHGFLNMCQVNVKAREGMKLMAKMMGEYLGVQTTVANKSSDREDEDVARVISEGGMFQD